jgi:hypothetical protein
MQPLHQQCSFRCAPSDVVYVGTSRCDQMRVCSVQTSKEAIFVQNDTYRAMRDVAEIAWLEAPCSHNDDKAWYNFTPATNNVWVMYLCDVVHLRMFKGVKMDKAERRSLMAFRFRASKLLLLVVTAVNVAMSDTTACRLCIKQLCT